MNCITKDASSKSLWAILWFYLESPALHQWVLILVFIVNVVITIISTAAEIFKRVLECKLIFFDDLPNCFFSSSMVTSHHHPWSSWHPPRSYRWSHPSSSHHQNLREWGGQGDEELSHQPLHPYWMRHCPSRCNRLPLGWYSRGSQMAPQHHKYEEVAKRSRKWRERISRGPKW